MLMLLVLEDVRCQCWLCWLLVVLAVAKLKISNCTKKLLIYIIRWMERGGGGGGGERGTGGKEGKGSIASVLYNMHANLCYSTAQHMFSYAVPESLTTILLKT